MEDFCPGGDCVMSWVESVVQFVVFVKSSPTCAESMDGVFGLVECGGSRPHL